MAHDTPHLPLTVNYSYSIKLLERSARVHQYLQNFRQNCQQDISSQARKYILSLPQHRTKIMSPFLVRPAAVCGFPSSTVVRLPSAEAGASCRGARTAHGRVGMLVVRTRPPGSNAHTDNQLTHSLSPSTRVNQDGISCTATPQVGSECHVHIHCQMAHCPESRARGRRVASLMVREHRRPAVHLACIGQRSLDILAEEAPMEVVPHSVVDKAPPLLLWLPRLVLEHHVVVPPPLHREAASVARSSARRVEQRVTL